MPDSRLQIASVCRLLPTPADASAGTFIINRLAAIGGIADVCVLQPVPFFPALRPLPAWARQPMRSLDGLDVVHAKMFYVPGVLKSFDGRWLARSIREHLHSLRKQGRLDLIDAHFGYPDGVGCALVAKEIGVPYFVTIRGLETDVLARPNAGAQLLQALRDAAGVISVSHSLRDLVCTYGCDPGHVLVAPNAVNRAIFRPGARADARARLGVPHDELLIVSVGNLLAVKRHTVLIEAVARLRERLPARLVIIGGASHEPEYPQLLQKQVERSGLTQVVHFSGKLPQAQIADWLRAANVFALASAREGCCNAVLEALASGLAVVATRVGDNPHFVQDGVNGYLVAPDDAAALAEALCSALTREWDAAAIARRLAVGTWADTASRVLEFMQARLAAQSTAKVLS